MIKAVNLGGWLVTEGWMKPSLFDNIPNKDFFVRFHCMSMFYTYKNRKLEQYNQLAVLLIHFVSLIYIDACSS